MFGEKELKWTEESIKQFVKDNNIKTRKELAIKASGAYNVARQCGLLDDLFGEKTQWTEESIKQFVKDNNIKTRKELAIKAGGAYNVARQLGILDNFFKKYTQSVQSTKWTEENIRQYVKDNNIKTRSELYYSSASAYNAANDLNILYDLFGEKKHKDWSEEDIKEIV